MAIKSDIRRRRIPQFCIFNSCPPSVWRIDFCILKLAFGQFESVRRSTIVESILQNHTFLCKTKPILKSYQCPQTLLYKQLTKNSALFGNQKTKPIQSQTKPILSAGGGFHLEAKMNATCLSQRDYEKILAFFRQKNKANSKPI